MPSWWRRSMSVAGLAVGVTVLLAGPAGGEVVDGLIVPGSPVTLTEGPDAATASIPVTNPTTAAITVRGAEDGNTCRVTVATGSRVAPGTSSTLSVTVEADAGCDDPAVDTQSVVLLATAEGSTGEPQRVEIAVKAPDEDEPEVEATGVTLPTDTVLLRHEDDRLVGAFDVLNTTDAAVVVSPSTVGDDCVITPATLDDEGTEVAPGASGQIEVSVPSACEHLRADTLPLSVLTSSTDDTAYGWGTVTLAAEVDWRWKGGAGLLILVLGCVLAFAAGQAGKKAADGASGSTSRALKWTDPVVATADAPKSWLTAIATVGPAATTLFTTTDLLDGLTGKDPAAPVTLVVVATAAALALVGVATMLSNIPAVSMVNTDKKEQHCPRIWQFVLAAGLTIGSAGLGLAAVWRAAVDIDLPGGDLGYDVVALLLALLLVGYGFWSVRRFIATFAKPETTGAPSGSASASARAAATAKAATAKVDGVTAKLAEQGADSEALSVARQAVAEADWTADAAEMAAAGGDSSEALVLSALASRQATAALGAVRAAAPQTAASALAEEVQDAGTLVDAAHDLAVQSFAAEITPVDESRQLTRFMI